MIANGLRIHGVDLASEDVLHSTGLVEFVEKHQLLEQADTASFNFAKAFGVTGDVYNIDREWLGQNMLSASNEQPTRQDQYPLFMKPDQKISVQDVANVLGATYKGTQLEANGERPMRVERQLESHIIQLRQDMPKELQGLIWQSFGVLPESVLVPLYSSLQGLPDTLSDRKRYLLGSVGLLAVPQPDSAGFCGTG